MYKIDIQQALQAPLDAVWSLVANFGDISWYPGPESVVTEGEGIGQLRRIRMPGMDQPIEEILEQCDEATHSIAYRIPATGANIMEDYKVQVQLTPTENGCEAHWLAEFSGIKDELLPGEQMVAIMEDTYRGMLTALEKAAQSAPAPSTSERALR